MPSTCTFELNKNPAVYYSGELVAGTVILHTTSPKNVRSIRLGLLGEAKVRWEESYTTTDSKGNSTRHTTYYRSHRTYIDNATHVMGEGTLPVGTHTYSFNIALPYQCPTSCEGKYGHIRYELSLVLDRPFRFDNVYKKPMTVIQTVDLNSNPTYKLPVLMEDISSLCCWPCNKGNLLTTFSIPFGAYAPGQYIKYAVNIQNQSMSDVNGYTVEFIQLYTFIATAPRHKERTNKYVLAAECKPDRCIRLTNRIFEGALRIPSIPPSTFMVDSPIIRVDYSLKVSVKLSGCHSSIDVKVPVYIGTLPLRESLTPQPPPPFQVNPFIHLEEPTAPDLMEGGEDNAGDLPPSYNDLKPPSFEEAMRSESPFEDTDIDERNRIIGFRPLYPMYQEKQ